MKRAALWAQLLQIAWERHRATSRGHVSRPLRWFCESLAPGHAGLYVIQQVEAY